MQSIGRDRLMAMALERWRGKQGATLEGIILVAIDLSSSNDILWENCCSLWFVWLLCCCDLWCWWIRFGSLMLLLISLLTKWFEDVALEYSAILWDLTVRFTSIGFLWIPPLAFGETSGFDWKVRLALKSLFLLDSWRSYLNAYPSTNLLCEESSAHWSISRGWIVNEVLRSSVKYEKGGQNLLTLFFLVALCCYRFCCGDLLGILQQWSILMRILEEVRTNGSGGVRRVASNFYDVVACDTVILGTNKRGVVVVGIRDYHAWGTRIIMAVSISRLSDHVLVDAAVVSAFPSLHHRWFYFDLSFTPKKLFVLCNTLTLATKYWFKNCRI